MGFVILFELGEKTGKIRDSFSWTDSGGARTGIVDRLVALRDDLQRVKGAWQSCAYDTPSFLHSSTCPRDTPPHRTLSCRFSRFSASPTHDYSEEIPKQKPLYSCLQLSSQLERSGSVGLPSADTCEVASAFNPYGQETVTARILIHATVAQVWRVLTDFEKLLDVVPHLIGCEEIPSPDPQYKRLRQSAGIKCSWWKLQAQALLEIQLTEHSTHSKELHFRMIEGDFKVCHHVAEWGMNGKSCLQEYSGRFLVEADPNGISSVLVFDAVIEPLESVPQMMFAHAVQIWLPFNLNGVVRKAEQVIFALSKDTCVMLCNADCHEGSKCLSIHRGFLGISSPVRGAICCSKKSRSLHQETPSKTVKLDLEFPLMWENVGVYRKRANPVDYLGTAFVPLPSSAPEFKALSMSKQSTLPAFELDPSQLQGVEVHLRKLDTPEYLHRRVVCSLRIGAPVKAVWNVLTDYSRLVDFVPNLAKSEVLSCPPGAPRGYHRIRQVVQKFQTYIQLQAESVMDVVEQPYSEIQFRQVSGFVQRLQGKWILKPLENDWSTEENDTLLTYALEIRTPHSDIPLELIEPVFEQAAVEGLPLNLTAIKQEVMRLQGRPSLARLCRDFDTLREELASCYMKNGNVFPTRLQLREDRRTDLEKAITAHGGPSTVPQCWDLYRKA